MNLVRLGFRKNRYRDLKILNGKIIFQKYRLPEEIILIIFCIAYYNRQRQIFAKKILELCKGLGLVVSIYWVRS